MTSSLGALVASPSPTAPGLGRRRRRFLILGVAALAVLAVALGVSFTADTGVSALSVVSGTAASNHVFPASPGSATGLPGSIVNSWKYGDVTTHVATSPSWTPTAGEAGAVTTSGDIAVIDGTDTASGGHLLLTIYVTNLNGLGKDYFNYAWPLRVYGSSSVTSNVITWGSTTVGGVDTSQTYLTNTSGYETFSLPTGANKYYEITMDAGGSFYTQSVSAGDLTPAFYITATPTA